MSGSYHSTPHWLRRGDKVSRPGQFQQQTLHFSIPESSFPPPSSSSSSSSSQQQYRSHPIQPSAHPMLNSRNHHFSSSSSSSSQDSNGNRGDGGGGGGDLDGTGEFLHRIIQTDLEPDELEQRVKIFIAQDRARGLDNPNSPTIKQQQQQFPRISARIPHGGSLSFSFSTNGGNTTMRIEDGQVPPHPMLSLDQKKQLKERLLAQKNDFISGPNTSAMILSSEGNEDQESGGKNGVGHQANVGSVAERVMWFEGFPQLQITHHPSGRMHRSAAHIALQNWRNANADFMAMDFPQLPPFASHSYTRSNSTSVEREIPIIREDDSGGKPALPRSSAASITLEVPSNKPVTTTRYGSTADATPSKPGNHALSAPTATPQTSFVTDPLQKAALLKATAPAGRGELKPVERIVPTILPSPEPKPIEKSWLKGDNLKNQEVLKEQEIKPTLVRQIGLKEVKEPEPKSAEVRKASLNIMKALQNGMSREDKKEEPVIKAPIVVPPPVPEKVMPKRASPPKTVTSPRSPPITSPFNYPTAKENVPPFHYPRGKPVKGDSDYILMEKVRKSFNNKPELKLDEMKDLMASLGLPLYWRRPLLLAAAGSGPAKDSVTFEMIWNTWKRITANCYDDASRFVCLLAKPGCNFLLPDDCTPLIQDVVDTHPGLNILKEAPEFHARYINTVIARMFFCINRSWTGRITIEELRRSNFLQVLATLEHEDDINVITDFFSYEHFYVIYCKFWELDRDHDLLIDKTDLARHNDHAISSKMIDRIFSGAVTRGQHQKNGKMSYSEFVWFLIAEEDKRHPRSVEYWFRCMDLDGDGVLSLYELEYFYEEQLQRMKSLGIEALPFEDIACQMLDMVHPKKKDRIILTDLKRCRMTPLFYDSFFNIEKYLLHEHRDPFASAKVDSEDNEPISDWERYAAEEYEMLVSEDAASEDL
ncbi:Serine/threonine-protein phosphatase 2A regulatory subunit B'' subunit alpha [Hypsibius exemplaris]|uniref:Serine/threonine-protein phosphatase 2A regulatory subunit B'' subunit alpha n=1 Tax=Hypsibius exemplaris TaxID=2072580 RepID=A0A1W0X121_HYPEX|nr:Serine/threonine-protein phosphatase 2A regulatory subunit B'' subunit alpha [Hypsibius exemplaris]